MKAPYLIINGEPAEIGQEYWTVNMDDGDKYRISKCVAGSENNIVSKCYFDNEADAIRYQKMGQLLLVLAPQVRAIEKMHQGDGFRMKLNY